MQQSEQGIRTRKHAHFLRQAFTSLSTEREPDQGQHFCEPKRLVGIRSNHMRQTLGKDFALAVCIEAEKPSGMQFQPHDTVHPSQISQNPNVTRMHFF